MNISTAIELSKTWTASGPSPSVSDAELIASLYVNDSVLALALEGETWAHRPYAEVAAMHGLTRAGVRERAVRILLRLRHPSPTLPASPNVPA